MIFYHKLTGSLGEDLSILDEFVTEQDIEGIVVGGNLEGNIQAISRIRFELWLDAGIQTRREYGPPLMVSGLDALDEHYYRENKHSRELVMLKGLSQALGKTKKILSDKKINPIVFSAVGKPQEFWASYSAHVNALEEGLRFLLHDQNAHLKAMNKNWGNLGYYKKFMEKGARLYEELSGEKFTSDFIRDKGKKDIVPATAGVRFLYGFHGILNKIAKKFDLPPFNDSTFASACNEIRKNLNVSKSNNEIY